MNCTTYSMIGKMEKLIEIPAEELDKIRKDFLSPKKIHNKIQCFASRYALNRCIEDMNSIARNGVFAITFAAHSKWMGDGFFYTFNVEIVPREEMREIRRRDFSLSEFFYHSHMFFEIPVVNMFTDDQIKDWQEYCLKTLARAAIFNKKKAAQWLKTKKIADMFSDD